MGPFRQKAKVVDRKKERKKNQKIKINIEKKIG
jgi:hypothetical protein